MNNSLTVLKKVFVCFCVFFTTREENLKTHVKDSETEDEDSDSYSEDEEMESKPSKPSSTTPKIFRVQQLTVGELGLYGIPENRANEIMKHVERIQSIFTFFKRF